MKIKYAIAAALMISVSAFAQKDELKAMRKIAESDKAPTAEDVKKFKEQLDKAAALEGNMDNEQKADFYYYKGMYSFISAQMNPMAGQAFINAAVENFNKVIELEKTNKKKVHTQEIKEGLYPELKALYVNQARALGQQNNYKGAAQMYEMAYKVEPKDTLNLYNAAAYATNAQDYDSALKNFLELERLGFTGSSLSYTAKNKEGQVEYFGDSKTRDLYIKGQGYTTPGIHREPSKRSDIVKNIALIYLQKGDNENAMKAIERAKKANPGDVSMLQAEAQIYLQQQNYDKYKQTVKQILDQGSTDPNLYFNLGVTTAKSPGQEEEAAQYYEKAIQLKPDFTAAYINLGILQLAGEQQLVDEMNKLGTSAKELKRYDELKAKRDGMYRKALVYLEKAYKIEPNNEDVTSVLGSLYQGLEMDAEYKALKNKK